MRQLDASIDMSLQRNGLDSHIAHAKKTQPFHPHKHMMHPSLVTAANLHIFIRGAPRGAQAPSAN
jgi:hypothetical protein